MATYGIGWALAVDVGVRVYIAEVVALLGLAFLNWRPIIRSYPIIKSVLKVYGLWVLAILISDIVNATNAFDMLRNISTPILGGVGLVFVAIFVAREPKSILTYFLAIGVAKAILGEPAYGDAFTSMELSFNSIQQDSNFFKVRFEPAITPLSISVAMLLSRRNLFFAGVWLISVSFLYFLMDARSAAVMIIVAGIVSTLAHFGFRFTGKNTLLASIVALLLSYGAYAAYVNYSLTRETPGHNALQLGYLENPYNPFTLLMIGRSEWLVMPTIIAEKPIFGWGSWARDQNNHFAYLRALRIGTADLGRADRSPQDLYMPAHSVVGAAWVWSGILGFIAMVRLAMLIWSVTPTLLSLGGSFIPVSAYFATFFFWHFLFSPPQTVRLGFPVALAVLIVMSGKIMIARREAMRGAGGIPSRGSASFPISSSSPSGD